MNQPGAANADRCPRCGGDFHCGVNDAGPCACSTLTLDGKTLAQLRERFSGCLCLRCLQAIAAGAAAVDIGDAGQMSKNTVSCAGSGDCSRMSKR